MYNTPHPTPLQLATISGHKEAVGEGGGSAGSGEGAAMAAGDLYVQVRGSGGVPPWGAAACGSGVLVADVGGVFVPLPGAQHPGGL